MNHCHLGSQERPIYHSYLFLTELNEDQKLEGEENEGSREYWCLPHTLQGPLPYSSTFWALGKAGELRIVEKHVFSTLPNEVC